MIAHFQIRRPAGLPAAGRRAGATAAWLLGLAGMLLTGCADHAHQLVVSIPEQRMAVLKNGVPFGVYPVSTSRFGLGDDPGRYATPLGNLEVASKIGDGLPAGAVLKSRTPTGEVLAVDAPGRDPVVTRILWLRGLDPGNEHAYDRYIYIHGTPEERNIGKPASFGCVRMRSNDIIALYDEVGTGARVIIANQPLAAAAAPVLAPGAAIPPPPPPPPAARGRMIRQPPRQERRPNGHVPGSGR